MTGGASTQPGSNPEPADGNQARSAELTGERAGSGLWATVRNAVLGNGPKYDEVLSSLATRLDGKFHDGGYPWGSHVDSQYKNANISVHTGSTAAGRAIVSRTTVTLEFPDKTPFDLELSPDGRLPKLYERLMRIKDLFPGDSDFEAAVTVHGAPEEMVRTMLSDPQVQEGLMAERSLMVSTVPDKEHAHGFLERYLGTTAPDGMRQVTIRLPFEVMNTDRLESLALLARSLYDQIERLSR